MGICIYIYISVCVWYMYYMLLYVYYMYPQLCCLHRGGSPNQDVFFIENSFTGDDLGGHHSRNLPNTLWKTNITMENHHFQLVNPL